MLDSNAKAKISKSKMEEMKDILKAESERKEKKPPDLNRLDKFSKFNYSYAVSFKEKAGEAKEFGRVGNIEGKIREEWEKGNNLARKMLRFGEKKIKDKHNGVKYSGKRSPPFGALLPLTPHLPGHHV